MSTYSEIVQLSQTDPTASVKNTGDYALDIQNNIIVKKGDNIIMKNAFLDTSAFDTQQIVLEDDITLEMDYIPYIMHNENFSGSTDARTAEGWTGVLDETGLPLMLCSRVLQDPTLVLVTSVIFFKLNLQNKAWGGITTTLKYTDWGGNTQHTHISIPPFAANDWLKTAYEKTGLTIHCKKDSIIDVTPKNLVTTGNYAPLNNIYNTGQTVYAQMTPQVTKVELKIDKGIYQPDELAAVISERAQTSRGINDGETFQFKAGQSLNAPFLQPLKSQTGENSMCILGPATYLNVAGDPKQYPVDIKFAGTTPYWIGASQVALSYDDTINKFFWSFLHTPAYGGIGSDPSQISVTFAPTGSNEPPLPYPPTNTSGVNIGFYKQSGGGAMFTSLRARNTKGDLIDFWDAILGFDLTQLCFPQTFKTFEFLFPSVTIYSYPDISNFIAGRNITLPEIIADMGVAKDTTYQQANDLIASSPNNTDKIYANRQVLEANLSTGFYFIDVMAEFQNVISNSNNTFKHTVGIVSNFYNQNSFVTGTSADSLIYTHNAEQPLILSSFSVRILDSTRSQPNNLGDNNHIFLEIVHNPTPAELLMQQEQAEEQIKQQLKKKMNS
tara:strand:+ start:1966 stop:3798 length:1833 start_codon:yes stop_codon:yes gene_type:complete